MLNRHGSALLKSQRLCFAGLCEHTYVKGARNASLNSAIQKGIYSSRNSYPSRDRREDRKSEDRQGWIQRDSRGKGSARWGNQTLSNTPGSPSSSGPVRLVGTDSWESSDSPREGQEENPRRRENRPMRLSINRWDGRGQVRKKVRLISGRNYRERRQQKWKLEGRPSEFELERSPTQQPDVAVTAPKSIPYTTAASEFIYGASAVMAALRCERRKFYILYIENTPDKVSLRLGSKPSRDPMIEKIIKYALALGVRVREVAGNWPQLLDKLSGGRPHNGCVLEASQLPKLPVDCLLPVSSPSNTHFDAKVRVQTAEEAAINGTSGRIPRAVYRDEDSAPEENDVKPSRYPLVLLLDGIRDEGNVGAILRSAYYFGVDAVAISTRFSAPISPIAVKASAGAAENITLLATTNPSGFASYSKANGWKLFAAEAPAAAKKSENTDGTRRERIYSRREVGKELDKAPCILMLGSEDKGLQNRLRRLADGAVVIPGAITAGDVEDRAGVDSLNVSVASALLCEAFLGDPSSAGQGSEPAEGMMSTVDMIREEAKEDPNKMF
ncbi:hypothetical protein AJ79_02499 [Helicocarpus griseus UAMH5409]|uniref:rRNA methyltransferase 1, mitochondrial n=1 Tax=Helicocarpus griseus UAMH5409 TaxID=1447875 RepID=A0A2B7Y2S0_9EURO|nr:hypothetical protein AJ79_02499 [Helicocarpus griseus UAMH5409]